MSCFGTFENKTHETKTSVFNCKLLMTAATICVSVEYFMMLLYIHSYCTTFFLGDSKNFKIISHHCPGM